MLRRLPWWGWLAVVWAVLMAAYNPTGASVYHLWEQGLWPLPLRLLATACVLAAIGLLCVATWKSIGLAGVVLMGVLVGLLLWTAVLYGALDPASSLLPHLLPQVVGAVVLTVGLRWAYVWRRATGQVIVEDGDA